MQTLKSTQAMADAMRGATKAMGAMNRQMNLPAMQKIMMEFERQNEVGCVVEQARRVWPACVHSIVVHTWSIGSGERGVRITL